MWYSNLIRLGGLAAMVGGVLYAGVGLLVGRLAEYLYYMGNIGYGFVAISLPLGTMAAIVALYALHREHYGKTKALPCLMAVLGLALATGALTLGTVFTRPDLATLFIVVLIGLLVATVCIVLLRALSVAWRILPRWCAIALMVGSPFGVFLTMIPSEVLAGGRSSRWAACFGWRWATTPSERQEDEPSDPQEECAKGSRLPRTTLNGSPTSQN
jgi:hypothetical protein